MYEHYQYARCANKNLAPTAVLPEVIISIYAQMEAGKPRRTRTCNPLIKSNLTVIGVLYACETAKKPHSYWAIILLESRRAVCTTAHFLHLVYIKRAMWSGPLSGVTKVRCNSHKSTLQTIVKKRSLSDTQVLTSRLAQTFLTHFLRFPDLAAVIMRPSRYLLPAVHRPPSTVHRSLLSKH